MLARNVIYFFFFEKTGKAVTALFYDHLTGSQLSYNYFGNICEKAWSRPYNYIVIVNYLIIRGKLRINWD